MGSFAGLALSLFWLFCEEAVITSSIQDVNQTSQFGLLNPGRMKTGKTAVRETSERARRSLSPTESSTFTTLKAQSSTTNTTILAEMLNSSPEVTTRSTMSIPDPETWMATATDLVTGVTSETTTSTLTSWRNATLSGAETTKTEPHAEGETSPPTSTVTERATPSPLSTTTTGPTGKDTYPPLSGSLIKVSTSTEPKTMGPLTETSTSDDSGKGMHRTVHTLEISTAAKRMAVTAVTTTKITPHAGTSISGSPSTEPRAPGISSETSNVDDSSEEITNESPAETPASQTSTIIIRATDSEKASATANFFAETSTTGSPSTEPGTTGVSSEISTSGGSNESINGTVSPMETSATTSSTTVMVMTTSETTPYTGNSIADSPSTEPGTTGVSSGTSNLDDSSEEEVKAGSPVETSTAQTSTVTNRAADLEKATVMTTSLPKTSIIISSSAEPGKTRAPSETSLGVFGEGINTAGSLARTSAAAGSTIVMRKTTTKTSSHATILITDSSSTALWTTGVPSGISTLGDSSEGTIITVSPTKTSTVDDAPLLGTSLANQRPFTSLLPKISTTPARQQTPTNETTSTAAGKLNSTSIGPGYQTPANLDSCLPGGDSGFFLLRLRVNSLLNLTDPEVGKWLLQQIQSDLRSQAPCSQLSLLQSRAEKKQPPQQHSRFFWRRTMPQARDSGR
ncbi:mucin-20 [Tachyglossus aculeatus]|uniref:mucin-20 n=1 Tax=Tachyglossus aculeatus TaxID=9261 RepID=UPI0018F661AD|nr:mucin-20 [Tachyglossus aculeatus]